MLLENKFYFPSVYSIPLFAVEKCHMAYALGEIPSRTFIDPLFRAVPRLPDDGVCSIVFDSLFSSNSACQLLFFITPLIFGEFPPFRLRNVLFLRRARHPSAEDKSPLQTRTKSD